MVNITHKGTTLRQAIAIAELQVSRQATMDAIVQGKVPKGDVFSFSRAAGMLACKKTSDLIPDCHPLPIEFCSIRHQIDGLKIIIEVEVHTVYKTGVEVEAMHGASVTALTMYDMLKPIDDAIEIQRIRLLEKKGGKSMYLDEGRKDIRIGIITCSDTVSKGLQQDKSGDEVERRILEKGFSVSHRTVVADEVDSIRSQTNKLIEASFDLIFFTGGTGLSPRDVTPEALAGLIDKEVPGIIEAARNYGQQRTPYAMFSRGIAGFAQDTLLITLPGSPRGVEESMDAIFPHIMHLFKVKQGARHE